MTEQKGVQVPDFVARMLVEESELDFKTEGLAAYLKTTAFDGLAKQEQFCLVRQHEYMKGYLYTLRCRLRTKAHQYGFEFKR